MKLFVATLLITSIVLTNAWSQILYSGLSIANKTDVVQKHNQLRSLLQQGKVSGQPKAAILKTIKYREDLANVAQAVSSSGNFQHVHDKDDQWWYFGQNLYVFTTTVTKYKETWTEVIQKWFDEHKDYHYPDASNSKTSNYTQIAWADTEYIGCGYTVFIKAPKGTIDHFFVCNYAPRGNIINEAPYVAA